VSAVVKSLRLGEAVAGEEGWRRSDFRRSWEGRRGGREDFSRGSSSSVPSRSSLITLKHSRIR